MQREAWHRSKRELADAASLGLREQKLKGMKCAYCAENTSTTGDHIFAREFFLKEDRDNLPQGPACKECNSRKAALEHYLITVLPLGGRHPRAKENLEANLPRRLAKNVRLHKELGATAKEAWIQDSSGAYTNRPVPSDSMARS